MTWLQQTVRFGTDPLALQEALYGISQRQAEAGKLDRDLALLVCDSDDFSTSTWLLSPAASAFENILPGQWVSTDPSDRVWGILYSAGATQEDLGLRPPR